MESPLISIIIPVYNVEEYLDRCVESAVNQTYKNIEIILVDDGSPDNCPALCDKWAEKDGRIRVIHKKNGGLSDARNTAVKESKGEYITFLDSDDYISLSMLEKLAARILEDKSDLAACNYELEGNWDIGNYYPLEDEVLSSDEALKKLVGDYYWHYDIACAKLYKRFLFDRVSFPVGKYHEDVYTMHLFFANCDKISFLSDALYYYCKNDGSIVHNFSVKRLDIADAVLQRFDFFYERNDFMSCHLCLSRVKDKLMQGYYELDRNEPEAKAALKKYHGEYNSRLKKIIFKSDGKRQKPVLIAFSLGYFPFRILNSINDFKNRFIYERKTNLGK